jgi:hypothetical protein
VTPSSMISTVSDMVIELRLRMPGKKRLDLKTSSQSEMAEPKSVCQEPVAKL